MPRTLPDICDELARLVEQRKQAWAETNLLREGILTQRIERLLDDMLAHPDYRAPVAAA